MKKLLSLSALVIALASAPVSFFELSATPQKGNVGQCCKCKPCKCNPCKCSSC